jgi:hypothetical protein
MSQTSRTNRSGTAGGKRRLPARVSSADTQANGVLASNVSDVGWPTAPSDAWLAQLHTFAEVIADMGAALNISPARLAEGEALERLEVVARLGVEQLARCDAARVRGWFAALADDLALDLRLDGQDPDLPAVAGALRAGDDPAGALQAFLASARRAAETQGDALRVEARLAVAKARALTLAGDLLAQRHGVAEPGHVAVFYSAAAWNALLSLATIPYLEQSGLVSAEGRTCVVLCDAPGYLAGAALECVGAGSSAAPDWLPVSPAALRQLVAHEEETRRLLAEEGGWPDAPRILTTEQLHLIARAPGLEATAARLATLRAELAAASLASVAQGNMANGLTLRFSGVRPATCVLPAHEERDATLTSGEALARLAEWATRRGTVDTLIIARECLARELSPGQAVSLAEVAQAAVDALEAAKANFTLFVRGQTDRYFTARQAAQDTVAAYAEAVRKAVSDLTGDVVDTVYRTVGLLAAVAVAGLIQPAVSPLLALLAAVLYSGYIAFIIFFLLRARDDRFALEQSALATRLAGMSELTTAERARIREPAATADSYFRRYMARTRLIYYTLLAAGVAVAVLLVALVHR